MLKPILLFFLAAGGCLQCSEPPLKPAGKISLGADAKGRFDHLAVDVKRQRLFLAAEDSHAVIVIDLKMNNVVQEVGGFGKPHAIFYRPDLDRLYVTDGETGELKILNGASYQQVSKVQLLKDADSIGYDPSTTLLFIDNGGGDVGASYSVVSAVNTTDGKSAFDLKVDGKTLEAMRLDTYRPRLYVNNKAKNEITVIDRWRRKIVASWPVTLGKNNVALALDEPRQRLFVACRDGHLVTFDTNTGKELSASPLPQGVDDAVFDAGSHTILAAGDGAVAVYDASDPDKLKPLGEVKTGPLGRTALWVPELGRYYVAVPSHDQEPATVLLFALERQVQSAKKVEEKAYEVHSGFAEKVVRETLSAHPDLRKMGLHAIQPGETESVIIANGNATRIGIPTSKGDFEAVKEGKTYCKAITDSSFYNLKMPMFDASGRRIGILVMEMPFTSATDGNDAIQKAEGIRAELSAKVPSLQALFAN